MNAMASKPPAPRLFTQPFIQAQIKENTKVPRHWPSCGGFTSDRWTARTKGQESGKRFRLMTSSWLEIVDLDLLTLGYPSSQPQKFEWPVWHCPLIYWPGNGRRPCVIFVPQMNVIHAIGDVTAQWLHDLEDIGQGQRSLRATHPLMLVIIYVK